MEELKYVKIKEHQSIIIFPKIINHSTFRHLSPVSAGFCRVNLDKKEVHCYGKSIGLELDSDPSFDSVWATHTVFGWDAGLALKAKLTNPT